ncbi:hypothetical protein COLU111180_12225 [Cohnella lubricantis]|uniref:Sporulation membrane protein YtrI C-terminal domain-containing protein n=1 Tax=Cohnella lubricantis TaxID=2163172 RepID=A0A841T3M7_9BACL|nr:hypothetical protein [Cohnella lubricantis]MBB6675934.1 hypothetical protein [Cohnella lubricantis]MBP2117950.1 hypothetical protein [Cohnella lubricantis]
MRVPDFKRYRGFMQSLAFFVCGMIVGAAVFHAMVLDQTNRIMVQNYEIKEQLNLAEKQLQANRQVSVIRSIIVFVLKPDGGKASLDAVSEVELKKAIEKDLSILIGRSVYNIGSDAELVRTLLQGKVYTDIGGKDLTVNIRTMLVADSVLQVWVDPVKALQRN